MRHYRDLKIEFNNQKELFSLITDLKKLKIKHWTIQAALSENFAKENNIKESELVSFMSVPLKYTKPKSEKEVFAGIVHLGIKDNSLVIFDIISVIKSEKLPVHLYNIILHKFVQEVIRLNPDLFGKTFGSIKLNRNKPVIPKITASHIGDRKSLVISVEPEKFKIFNDRLKRPMHFISRDESGESLMLECESAKIEKKEIRYFTPNNISILLSVSDKSKIEAKRLLKEIKCRKRIDNALSDIKESSEIICDFIEQLQTSIVFTYTSIEAFVNLSIPENYEYFEIKKEAGVHYEKRFEGNSIERLLPLKTKIKEILPDIYETDPVEKEMFFVNFDRLEKLRNKIIHQKSIEHTELYKEYFRDSIFRVCDVANELITFFYENCESDFSTNPIWPTISGKEANFPKAYFDSGDFEELDSFFD
jgi:hypothetical protein